MWFVDYNADVFIALIHVKMLCVPQRHQSHVATFKPAELSRQLKLQIQAEIFKGTQYLFI